MKHEYRLSLLALSIVALVVAGVLTGVHASMVSVDPYLEDAPTADAVINSHARIMLALGVAAGSFVTWCLIGALTGREPATETVTGPTASAGV